MKHVVIVCLSACSQAASPSVDAHIAPRDANNVTVDSAIDGAMGGTVRILALNEVAPSETPDWFEIVNATTTAIQLGDFVYVDVAGDFAKAKAFPTMMLGPGARYVQNVDDVTSGFKLASDEELWIYRASDHALSDGVDWAEGAAPAGMSYARSPDVFGPFVTGAQSRGAANP
jgi:hypothetical protein